MAIDLRIRAALQELKEHPAIFAPVYGEMGLFGISVPEEYGGSALSLQDILELVSLISQTGLSGPAMLGSHLRVCHYIAHFGTSEQRDGYLPKLASGECLAAHARTEHDSPVKARREDGFYVLNGIKPYVTNARDANLIAVTANSNNDIFLVDRDNPGLVIGEDIPRVGVLDTSLCSVYLNDCYVSLDTLLGRDEGCAWPFLVETKMLALMNYTARAHGVLHGLRQLISESPVKAIPNWENTLGNLDTRIERVKSVLDKAIEGVGNDASLLEYISSGRVRSVQFCIDTLDEMHCSYMYTNEAFARFYRDIPSLAIIGGRDDTRINT